MGGLRPRLLLYLFKSAKGQASERYEVYSFFYLLSTKNCVHCVANLRRSIRGVSNSWIIYLWGVRLNKKLSRGGEFG